MGENEGVAREILAEATGLTLSEVPEDASLHTLESWDSLSHMRLILKIEEQLGCELDPEKIIEIQSIDDIAQILEVS